MQRAVRATALLAILMLAGCSGLLVTEDTPMAVTVRYDGIVHHLADATALAERACARHGKTARLRRTDDEHYVAQHFAHYACL